MRERALLWEVGESGYPSFEAGDSASRFVAVQWVVASLCQSRKGAITCNGRKRLVNRAWTNLPEMARDLVHVGANEKVHESTKLGAVFDALLSEGFSTEQILRGVGVAPECVHSPKTRVSLKQLTTAYQNAMRLSADRHLPYRIGTAIHVSTYGMYGYALLSCPDFRKAMEFAAKYHALAAPLAAIEFSEDHEGAIWRIEPAPHGVAVNARSLRRQLQQQGISFRELLDELRTQLAIRYLRSTDLANEDIALALGFSDAANFRRAFHRWTNKSPSEVRADQT
jgi:AraC-like DNA-binding protein